MRKIKLFMAALAAVLVITTSSWAVSVPFTVSASIPAATGISIVATQVNSANNQFGAQVTALDFNPMAFNATNKVWLPDHYFAIDVGATGGAGNPNITVKYAEGAKPVGQPNGLGFKSIATFVKITGGPAPADQIQTDLAAHPKKPLKNITAGEVIGNAEIAGGFFRVYIGIYPGGDAALAALGAEPFTNGDKSGNYDGTLTITAVLP